MGLTKVRLFEEDVASRANPKIVRVIVTNPQGQVLICERPKQDMAGGLWNFPGGKAAFGEAPEIEAIREAYDEVGIRLETVSLFHIWRFTTNQPPDWDSYYYIAGELSPEQLHNLTLNPEAAASMAFVGPDDLDKYQFIPGDKDVLVAFFAQVTEQNTAS